MEQLSGLDAGFLYMETPTLHMHTIKVAVIDASKLPCGYSFDWFRVALDQHLHLLPPFRRRLVDVPLGLGHPLWIEDPDFNLENHLSTRRVEPPGGMVELCRIVSEIASEKLDRRIPLWQLVVVEGLESNRVAIVAKIHHSVADGVATFELLMNAMLRGGVRVGASSASDDWKPDPVPTRRELLEIALRECKARVRRLPRLILDTFRGLWELLHHVVTYRRPAPVPFRTPLTSFNRALTARRTFATQSLPLADLRKVARALDVKLNDVVLGVCAGALRRYFTSRGEHHTRSLVVGVPIDTRPGEEKRLSGNHVGNLIGTLRTDLADPIERIRAIHETMEEVKQRQVALGADILEQWAEFAPPSPFASVVKAWSRWRMGSHSHPPINLIVSNVRGPDEALESHGVRLVSIHSVGPILEGAALNITAWSYAGQVYFSLIACPESVPDPWKLISLLPESLDEISKALEEGTNTDRDIPPPVATD